MPVPDFARAFAGPATFWDGEAGQRVITEPREVGALEIPSGRVAVHDPGYEFAPEPLDRDVPAGTHPVDLALRSWMSEGGIEIPAAIIAAARIRVAATPVHGYVPVRSATTAGDAVFGVDSGLIAVFDRTVSARLGRVAILDALPGAVPEFEPGVVPAHVIHGPDNASIFVCQAGKGDGAYVGWWGLDRDEAVVELIVDFGELVQNSWHVIEVPAGAFLGGAARLRLALAGSGVELEPVPASSTGAPIPWADPAIITAFRRRPGPLWEFSLLDASGAWIGGPGLAQLEPGPWFELFETEKLERATTVRIRIHQGLLPLVPIEPSPG